MQRFALILSASVLVLAACGDGGKKPAPAKAAKAAPDAKAKKDAKQDQKAAPANPEAQLARGKYLAEAVMNCKACHTPLDESGPVADKEYAGGLEVTEAFGTWRSPNITQDQKTGIGGWTDEQIIAAVREGKRPTGEQMYPVMPYDYFASATDEDMKALVAYLRTVKPIENAVAGNTDLKLDKPKAQGVGKGQTGGDFVATGEYLVKLAHCGRCHTPLMPDGKPDADKFLAGGREFNAFEYQGKGKVWSANLTPDKNTGIGGYSEDEIVKAIVELDKRDGTAIVGPMTFYIGSWSNLNSIDAKAIAKYLQSLPPVANEVPKATWKPATPQQPAEGEAEGKAAGDAKAAKPTKKE